MVKVARPASSVCTQFFAVELARLAGRNELMNDCGGRTPNYNNSNVWRSLAIAGTTNTTSWRLRILRALIIEHPRAS